MFGFLRPPPLDVALAEMEARIERGDYREAGAVGFKFIKKVRYDRSFSVEERHTRLAYVYTLMLKAAALLAVRDEPQDKYEVLVSAFSCHRMAGKYLQSILLDENAEYRTDKPAFEKIGEIKDYYDLIYANFPEEAEAADIEANETISRAEVLQRGW